MLKFFKKSSKSLKYVGVTVEGREMNFNTANHGPNLKIWMEGTLVYPPYNHTCIYVYGIYFHLNSLQSQRSNV